MRRDPHSAWCRHPLAVQFRSFGLGLKVLEHPFDARNPSIFQFDINRTRDFGEYFRLWRGAQANKVELLSGDASIKQVLLRVKEARRAYTQTVRRSEFVKRSEVEAEARKAGGKIIAESRDEWTIQLWTPDEERRYLCGMDDVTLFVAQVREGSTVKEAHESLAPSEVRELEAETPGATVRQGEWFFLPLTVPQVRVLEETMKAKPGLIREAARVGQGNRPHVADQVVRIETRLRGKHRSFVREDVYARGVVRHPGHRDLILDEWRRVVRNREVEARPGELLRVLWID